MFRKKSGEQVSGLTKICYYNCARSAGAMTATKYEDFPRLVLGIAIMCILVTLFNRLLWRPLYAFGERRIRLG
jgi:ABC-type anion transport system duplicated permease subunit